MTTKSEGFNTAELLAAGSLASSLISALAQIFTGKDVGLLTLVLGMGVMGLCYLGMPAVRAGLAPRANIEVLRKTFVLAVLAVMASVAAFYMGFAGGAHAVENSTLVCLLVGASVLVIGGVSRLLTPQTTQG